MELTASGRILNNEIEKFGVEAIRPTINSYMYGDAKAISKISLLADNIATSKEFEKKANKIKITSFTTMSALKKSDIRVNSSFT